MNPVEQMFALQGLFHFIKECGETLKEEGKQEKAVETCKRMLEPGLSLDILQKSTELSEEEIQKTQSKLQSGFVNKIV